MPHTPLPSLLPPDNEPESVVLIQGLDGAFLRFAVGSSETVLPSTGQSFAPPLKSPKKTGMALHVQYRNNLEILADLICSFSEYL